MQNHIDTIGSLFLNQIREELQSTENFSDLVLRKMSQFNFPRDKSNNHWNKMTGSEFNHMLKNSASTNTFFIIADQYFNISIVVINTRGDTLIFDGEENVEAFSPYKDDDYFYVYSKDKQSKEIYIRYLKNLQRDVSVQKIKKSKKGKRLI